jgi:hypothetical protein
MKPGVYVHSTAQLLASPTIKLQSGGGLAGQEHPQISRRSLSSSILQAEST